MHEAQEKAEDAVMTLAYDDAENYLAEHPNASDIVGVFARTLAPKESKAVVEGFNKAFNTDLWELYEHAYTITLSEVS
jgi:hypothetical protein